jgi:energy-coupling factor transporter ATP-binding protein EcfA2
MINISQSILYDGFNARYLSPIHVAKSFIPPPSFQQLLHSENTLLVGPRGSGKTTLLKMLTQPALETWNYKGANALVESCKFSTAFVPNDRRLYEQLKNLRGAKLTEDVQRNFTLSAYVSLAQKSLVEAFSCRIKKSSDGARSFRPITISWNQEQEIARRLARDWSLSPEILSLSAISNSLGQRLLQIPRDAQKASIHKLENQQNFLNEIEYFFPNLFDSLIQGIDIFTDITNNPDDKWAIALDELELTPDPVFFEVMNSLRGIPSAKLILKLAINPIFNVDKDINKLLYPSEGHDFNSISLWYPYKDESNIFCNNLWNYMVEQQMKTLSVTTDKVSPIEILGESYFSTDSTEKKVVKDYSPDGKWGKTFMSLEKKDSTFKNYLLKINIRSSDLLSVSKTKMDKYIRKIAPLVYLRDFYLKSFPEGKKTGFRRSRKSLEPYTGAEALFAATEGNPRIFISLIGSLLSEWTPGQKISVEVQSKQLEIQSDKFFSGLRNKSAGNSRIPKNHKSVQFLLKTLGDYLSNANIFSKFTSDPPISIDIPINIDTQTEELLSLAIYVGALIPHSPSSISSVKGITVRFNYLLASYFKLPIRRGKSISINKILSNLKSSDSTKIIDNIEQVSLFESERD